MTNKIDICTLDYLIGTLATAYKGLITSLIAKDFCITSENNSTLFRGTILSMPAGDYFLSLMQGGIEIGKTPLHDGYFELAVRSSAIEEAKNLQLDLVQEGKHIGTFLLKREKSGGTYSSAFELREELQMFNFHRLDVQLEEKKGLQKKGESIIAAVVSTKKDWKKLSDDINTFAKDLFWSDLQAFTDWYELLVRFASKAAQNADARTEMKTISNLLNLIELPLERKIDKEHLSPLIDTWFRVVCALSLNISLRFRNVMRIFRSVQGFLPDYDLTSAMKALLDSLDSRLTNSLFLNDSILNILDRYVNSDEQQAIRKFSYKEREYMISMIRQAQEQLKKHSDIEGVLNMIDSVDTDLFDSRRIIENFFLLLKNNIEDIPPRDLVILLSEVSDFVRQLPPETYNNALLDFIHIINQLVRDDRLEHIMVILDFIEKTDASLKDDIVFNEDFVRELFRSDNSAFFTRYDEILRKIVIPPPQTTGFSDETWAELSNPHHMKRLGGFINVIRLDSSKFRNILIHLISNLFVSGVFIPDDKLFQRNISAYLNSGQITHDYILNYLLLKKLPVFYHEVGASGRIRDLTTEIDSWGNDPVLYFLRKQVHVNASNYNIQLIENIIKAWTFNKPKMLFNAVPDEIFNNINRKLFNLYSPALRSLLESSGILKDDDFNIKKIVKLSDHELENYGNELKATEEVKSKIILLCKIYRSVVQKYSQIETGESRDRNPHIILSDFVSELIKLKQIYTSPERTSAQESFYFKRHIAFGIPSVIGSYHEPKFDAFGKSLQIEEKFRLILEDIISDIKGSRDHVSIEDIRSWLLSLSPVHGLFSIHGLDNPVVREILHLLNANSLYLSQVNDLLRMWQKELTWMVEMIYRTFHRPLSHILRSCSQEDLPEHLRRLEGEGKTFINRATDIIIRDILNSITGFEELDRLLNSLIECIGRYVETVSDEIISLSDHIVPSRDFVAFEDLTEEETLAYAPMLGNKAKNLIILFNKKLPVPYGVVFSSGHTFDFQDYVKSEEFDKELKQAISRLEYRTGCTLGDSKNPLFVSVRSGSYISMPGILSSILYCGMNETTHQALIKNTGDPRFAWDSYRRFIEHYASVVQGVRTEDYDKISQEIIYRYGVKNIRDLDAQQLEDLAVSYLGLLDASGLSIPDDPFEQIRNAVAGIYRSWFDERAVQFRKAMNVSDHWGTAVAIVQMIHANSANAGASVFFTRKPFSLGKGVYGETRKMSTGDDLVYGKLSSRPLSKEQAGIDGQSLEEIDPELYRLHVETAEQIERAIGKLPQEVEAAYVTNEHGKRELYVLQTKRMEFHRGYTRKFQDICRMESSIIGRGIGVHGGALSGVVTFSDSPEHVMKLKHTYDQPLILLRSETSTDDVALMPEVDGIITALGGATSHAAILSQKFNLTAVVGCSDLNITVDERGNRSALIGDFEVYEGTSISIDGSSGLVYSGVCLLTEKQERY